MGDLAVGAAQERVLRRDLNRERKKMSMTSFRGQRVTQKLWLIFILLILFRKVNNGITRKIKPPKVISNSSSG